MERENDIDLPEATRMFMSHPHLKMRIENAVKFDLPEDFEENPLEINWEEVKKELDYY